MQSADINLRMGDLFIHDVYYLSVQPMLFLGSVDLDVAKHGYSRDGEFAVLLSDGQLGWFYRNELCYGVEILQRFKECVDNVGSPE